LSSEGEKEQRLKQRKAKREYMLQHKNETKKISEAKMKSKHAAKKKETKRKEDKHNCHTNENRSIGEGSDWGCERTRKRRASATRKHKPTKHHNERK
jgi:hypothetical protein